ncbi:hypothetical protein FFI89_000930 [Bradyrhizobium sp. KBS0727]|uniref:hypothetical protein n=1 Tax=unclassified Bradyrhizobium TaxID=2631580 RepID=UPI00110EDE5D|nr:MULTISPECIES: hypothetical protein [unclassified Bradyrhizobium]QDW35828.1 hypothetical protein FFI71_000930 [Bradyrhizobium sp. KBS0725]QDW42428.1 hypothetical protein FFI89_000930 [Bradyrhizobium sp. KBS0727]
MSKEYPKLLNERFKWIARQGLVSDYKAIDRRRLARSFSLVAAIIDCGDDEDKPVLDAFRKTQLNYNDPFHWWELLHAFCSVHSKRPKRRLWTEKRKKQLVKDAVAAGSRGMSIFAICQEMKRRKPKEWLQVPENLQAQITRFDLTQEIRRKIEAKRSIQKSVRSSAPRRTKNPT